MRIGIVCYPTYGGSGVVATELGIALAQKGHEVNFITYSRPARLNRYFENIYFHEVSAKSYPLFQYSPYETALASKIVDVAKYNQLDLLHVHYAIPHAAVAFMAKQVLAATGYHLPIVTTLHGTDITLVGSDKSFHPVVEFSINNSDGVTAVSNNLREKTLQHFNIKNEVKVIHNFIDFERFKRTDKEHFRKILAPNGEKILAHTSNFRKVKRVQDVIHVFKRVVEKLPAKLILIGDGPERQNLEMLCREIGVCSDIRFLGKQDAVEELLAISDLFILPSENESFGLSALEAMACELPVLSTNIGGLPEVNVDGETGYLFDVGDVDSFAEKAIEILTNEELYNKLSQNAKVRAGLFDIDKIVKEYESYYEVIIERSKANKATNV